MTRSFDYAGDPFAAGRHRGVDFAARPGAPVRSACAGRVVFAAVAGSNGTTVSVRCGAWRVAYLPLRTLAVRRGARVARGALLGTAAGPGRHVGVHIGVRREGSRWAYVDPLRFFGASGRPPLAPRAPATRRPAPFPPLQPAPERPVAAPDERPVAVPARPLAPWPAWAGLALVLTGACGAGVGRRRRHATRPHGAATPSALPRVGKAIGPVAGAVRRVGGAKAAKVANASPSDSNLAQDRFI